MKVLDDSIGLNRVFIDGKEVGKVLETPGLTQKPPEMQPQPWETTRNAWKRWNAMFVQVMTKAEEQGVIKWEPGNTLQIYVGPQRIDFSYEEAAALIPLFGMLELMMEEP
jgi:hypothetical protein